MHILALVACCLVPDTRQYGVGETKFCSKSLDTQYSLYLSRNPIRTEESEGGREGGREGGS